jgi:hypothetical protein
MLSLPYPRLRTAAAFSLAVAVGAAGMIGAAPKATDSAPRLRYFAHVEVPYQPMEVLARYADDVVHGTVVAHRFDRLESGFPATIYSIQVHSALRNKVGATIEVTVAGAVDGPLLGDVEQAPVFENGDQAVLFLTSAPDDDRLGILGLDLGALHVHQAAGEPARVEGRLSAGEDLAEFLARVEASIAGEEGGETR